MATRTFELSTRVPVAPATVIDFLADLAAHRGMHAYLVGAEVVDEGRDADGTWQDWRVTERPALGPFRYTIRFPARMRRRSATELSGDVAAAPGCRLVTETHATADGEGAVVTELTTVTAPVLLAGYMTKHARIAHERTFSLLSRELAR